MTYDSQDLYATLMHELKNHLGLLALTIDRIPTGQESEHDKAVEEARLLCQRVVDRLQQALLMYKAASGKIHPAIDAYSVEDMVRELCDTAAGLARGRLQVTAHLDANLPALAFFDRNLIEMALINAIHNSITYAHRWIRIEAGMSEERLMLTIRDDSDGYPDTILRYLNDDRPHTAGGTGLGLQFARLIVLTHVNRGRTGELRLSNDGGAVFSLLLP
jgi:K+-sensing histidine kinase KdpD